MPGELVRWAGRLDGPRSFKGGYFYGWVEVKSDLIQPESAVMASVSEADDAGERFPGDTVIVVGAIVPYAGGAHVQIGTDSLGPWPVSLAITLLVIRPG